MKILSFIQFFGSILPSWIRIRICNLYADPDPAAQIMRIHADPEPCKGPQNLWDIVTCSCEPANRAHRFPFIHVGTVPGYLQSPEDVLGTKCCYDTTACFSEQNRSRDGTTIQSIRGTLLYICIGIRNRKYFRIQIQLGLWIVHSIWESRSR